MESLKDSISKLREHFESKMADFQKSIQASSIPATSPTSNIAAQFSVFRSFVLNALEGLQLQLGILAGKCDELEMRSRRKILLVHGIQESKSEKATEAVVNFLSEHLKITDLKVDNISRCHRLGHTKSNKPRPILIKFQDITMRNKVWFGKTGLKNSGVTVSEFLTKERHETFVEARKRFGISKSWTMNGKVVVIGSDDTHHHISSLSELNSISYTEGLTSSQTTGAPTATSDGTSASKHGKAPQTRSRRPYKK